jgi:hypothetical protein
MKLFNYKNLFFSGGVVMSLVASGKIFAESKTPVFPEKTAVLKKVLALADTKPSNLADVEESDSVANLLISDLAQHQNGSKGVNFKAVCQEPFVAQASLEFASTCTLTVKGKTRKDDITIATYTVNVVTSDINTESGEVSNFSVSKVIREFDIQEAKK